MRPAAPKDFDSALDAMRAEELRAFVRGLAGTLDGRPRAKLEATLLEHASRGTAGWRPTAPARSVISEIESFVSAARRIGLATPEEVDGYLRQGVKAFLAGDFATARAVFQALLPPLAECEFDLGQQELLDEVLTESIPECVARCAVAVYCTTPLEERADAVFEVMEAVGGIAFLDAPLAAMERVAMKPLPELAEFLPRWVARLERRPAPAGPWDSAGDRMLREAVSRCEGVAGLERVALTSRKPEALRAWCSALVERGAWQDALRAYEEAAELAPSPTWRGDFLDGAALAALQLGRTDFTRRLEKAWRDAPSLTRLLRWLDAGSPEAAPLKRRATLALEKSPTTAPRLIGLLRLVSGDIAGAARLLAKARGLGWSSVEHPGHVLFPAFALLLGGAPAGTLRSELALPLLRPPTRLPDLGFDMDFEEGDAPVTPLSGLPTPSVLPVLQRSRSLEHLKESDRRTMRQALRAAASARTHAVLREKRRSTYRHAALLVACCVELDTLAGNARAEASWVAELRDQTRRFPAFQAALREALDRVQGSPRLP